MVAGEQRLCLSSAGWILFSCAVATFGVVVPIWLVPDVSIIVAPHALLAFALGLYAAIKIALAVARGEPRFLQLMAWTFFYLWGSIAPLAQFSTGRYPWGFEYPVGNELHAIVVVAIGILSFDLGYAVQWQLGDAKRIAHQRISGVRTVSSRRLLVLCLAAICLASAAVYEYGIGAFFSSREGFGRALAQVAGSHLTETGIRTAAATVPIFVAMYLVIRIRPPRPTWTYVVLPFLVGLNLVVNNPWSNSRYWVGCIVFATAISVFPPTNRFRSRLIAILAISSIILVFPLAAAFRTSSTDDRPALTRERIATSGDYDAYIQTVNGIRTVDLRGHSYGNQLASTALFWVPRSLWEGKASPAGELVAGEAGLDFVNLSSPLWFEAYLDFWWLGTIVIMMVAGGLSQRLDRGLVVSERGLWGHVAPFAAGYIVIMLRGPLLGVIGKFAVGLALMVAVTSPTRRKERTSRSSFVGKRVVDSGLRP